MIAAVLGTLQPEHLLGCGVANTKTPARDIAMHDSSRPHIWT
jgi:hypothetical protein